MRILIVILAIVSGMVMAPPASLAENGSASRTILIFPFEVHAQDDLGYLSEAAREMLASRLAQPGRIDVIEETSTVSDVSEAVSRARQQSADYMVMGSLSFLGQEVSIDASVLEAGSAKPVLVFSELGNIGDGVLVHIQSLAARIKQTVSTSTPPPPAVRDGGESAPLTTTAKTDKSPSVAVWESRRLDLTIVGLGVGDITGDGRNELVAADENRVKIFSLQAGRLIQIQEVVQKRSMKIIGVDVADINANRKAEIYLTMERKNGGIGSAVLEYDGKTVATIASGLEWFFRVQAVLDGERTVLTGQKEGAFLSVAPDAGKKGVFDAHIYRLAWENGKLIPRNRLDLPRRTNIYSFASGAVMGDGANQTLDYDSDDRLTLLTRSGETVWQSEFPFGGTMVYLETKPEIGFEEKGRYYLNQRILLTGENDGEPLRILVVKNEEVGKRLFTRFRKFTAAWIRMLAWDGNALQTDWQTNRLQGYISDFAIADLNNDGRMDVVCALAPVAGSLARKQASRILMFEVPGIH